MFRNPVIPLNLTLEGQKSKLLRFQILIGRRSVHGSILIQMSHKTIWGRLGLSAVPATFLVDLTILFVSVVEPILVVPELDASTQGTAILNLCNSSIIYENQLYGSMRKAPFRQELLTASAHILNTIVVTSCSWKWLGGQVVRRRSRKPKIRGSIPRRAFIFLL